MLLDGYIKLYRSLLDWQWYTDTETFRVFMHILLCVNWKETKYKGVTVPAGSYITSVNNLAAETGLTVRQVRTALQHLEQSHAIRRKSTNKWQAITVENWAIYQGAVPESDKQATNKRQTSDKPTEEESKEGKKERTKNTHKECVAYTTIAELLSDDDIDLLTAKVDGLGDVIDEIDSTCDIRQVRNPVPFILGVARRMNKVKGRW